MLFSDTNRGSYRTASSIGDEPSSTELTIGNLTLSREFGFGEFTSSTSWLHRDADSSIDYTPLAFNFFGLQDPVANHNPTESESFVTGVPPVIERRRSTWLDCRNLLLRHRPGTHRDLRGAGACRFHADARGRPASTEFAGAIQLPADERDRQLAGFVELSYAVNETVEFVAGARISQLTAKVSNTCTESASFAVLCSADFPAIESDESAIELGSPSGDDVPNTTS